MTTKPVIDRRIDATTIEGRGIFDSATANIDYIGATIGLALVLAAITLLTTWEWAMLAGGITLIALALVVPTWDS